MRQQEDNRLLLTATFVSLCNTCNSFPLDNYLQSLYGTSMKAYLNAAEVAKLLNVDRATVSRWIKKGIIHGAFRPDSEQQWRIPFASYEELRKQQLYENR